MLSIDFNNEVIKAAPIAGAVGADATLRTFWGLSMNEWFYAAAIAYTVAQILAKAVETYLKYRKEVRNVTPDGRDVA